MIRKIVGTVLSLALSVGAYFLWAQAQEKAAEVSVPDPGTCLKLTGAASDADHKETDCDDSGATYEVVATQGTCDTTEVSYTITLSNVSSSVADLCLALNADKGECFKLGGVSTPDEKVDCSTSKGDSSVSKVIHVADRASGTCPKGTTAVRNKTRQTLICMGSST